MPLRDDWVSASTLIERLDEALPPSLCTITVVLVDDGSSIACDLANRWTHFQNISAVQVLRLRRNLGHQRAICIGLLYVKEHHECDAVLVLDADGEDTPEGAVKLIHTFSNLGKAVFAQRSRRTESFAFRLFYRFYRALHLLLTGLAVRVGNFSILPASYLSTLSVMPELWNHYAAAVFRSRLPYSMVPIARGRRIAGQSTMNFVALISHGLSAISVYGDVVGVRLLIASLIGSIVAALAAVAVIGIRVFTNLAVPGWATYGVGMSAIIGIQLLTMAVSFSFVILSSRTHLGFVPIRDYSLFVGEFVQVWPHD